MEDGFPAVVLPAASQTPADALGCEVERGDAEEELEEAGATAAAAASLLLGFFKSWRQKFELVTE